MESDGGTAKQPKSRCAHLARWQFRKGVSGNPRGRPRKPSFVKLCREYLSEADDPAEPTKSRMLRLLGCLYLRSLNGDAKSAKLILERVSPVSIRVDKRDLRVLNVVIRRQDADPLDAGQLLSDNVTTPRRLESDVQSECEE